MGIRYEGDNDCATVIYDYATGARASTASSATAGNWSGRFTQSTLAALSTYQQARRLGILERPVLGLDGRVVRGALPQR